MYDSYIFKPSGYLFDSEDEYYDKYRAYQIEVENGAFIDSNGYISPEIIPDYEGEGAFFSKSLWSPAADTVTPSGDGAPVSGGIMITFSKQMSKTTPGAVELEWDYGTVAAAGGSWSADGRTYIASYSGLREGTEYTINISDFTDPDGNEVVPKVVDDEEVIFKFTTAGTQIDPEAPEITTPTLGSGTVNREYRQELSATGDIPITWSISAAGELPDGLTLDETTGVISGIPTTVGDSTFTVKASNEIGNVTKNFTITINLEPIAPDITPADLPVGTVGVAYSQTLSATGDAPITWSYNGRLPAGLTLDETTGVISGTPTTAETAAFTVKAENAEGNDIELFIITISDAPVAPSITTTTLDNGTVGTPYTQTLLATGDEPIAWSITGNLPVGLNLDPSTGIISGTPTTAGDSTFTIKASNGVNPDAAKTFSVTINTAPAAPEITTQNLASGTVGRSYSQILTATGETPITWTLSSGTLPAGLALNPAGLISGTPTTLGDFTFTIKA
jgi:hypothetical protein